MGLHSQGFIHCDIDSAGWPGEAVSLAWFLAKKLAPKIGPKIDPKNRPLAGLSRPVG
jgi:hypothetical protein